MRIFLSLLVLTMVVTGCSMRGKVRKEEFNRVWVATKEVLERHNFIVRPAGYHEKTLVAVSRVNTNCLNKARVKVVAQIIRDQDGYLEPSIRVVNQMDISDTNFWGHPNTQDNHHWVNLSANESMEAKIYNDIMQLLREENKAHKVHKQHEWYKDPESIKTQDSQEQEEPQKFSGKSIKA